MVRRTPILIAVAIFPLTFELAKETPKGPVPVVRLEVKAPERENLDLLASVLEGRLLARLHEAETFHLVARDKDAPYTLLLEVQDLKYNVQVERQKPYDAEANPERLGIQNMLGAELAKAEERKGSFEVSEFISYADFAPKTRLKGNAGAGLRIGYNFNSWLEGELSYHRSENAEFTKLSAPSVDVEEVQAVAILNWKRKGKKFQTRFQPYMILGFGHADYNPPAGEDFRQASRLSRKEGLKTTVYQKEAAHEAGGSTEAWGFGSKF